MTFKIYPNKAIKDPQGQLVSMKDIADMIIRGHRNIQVINKFSGRDVTNEIIKHLSFNVTGIDVSKLYGSGNR